MYYNYGYSMAYVVGYLLVFIGFIITLGTQIMVNSSYSKYKKINNSKRVSGRDAARRILDENGLTNIDIVETRGNLTDHYDPTRKVVRLSTEIYNGTSIASVAVAAHECGHAIQDKEGYRPLKIRSAIIPTVNLCNRIGYFVIFLGLILGYFNLAIFGLILMSAILVFQLVTLPVEFNASGRAKKQIDKLNIIEKKEQDGVSNMLTAAAMTYVASVINTILQLLRMLLIILDRNDRE